MHKFNSINLKSDNRILLLIQDLTPLNFFSSLPQVSSFSHTPIILTRSPNFFYMLNYLETDYNIWSSLLHFTHKFSHIEQFWKFFHDIINYCSYFLLPAFIHLKKINQEHMYLLLA